MRQSLSSHSLHRLVSGILAVAASAAASAQQVGPSAPAPAEMADIVVTGSLIRRTDAETASPVTVLSAEDLIKSGYTDISDVLRNISANGANNLSQGFNGDFAAGA